MGYNYVYINVGSYNLIVCLRLVSTLRFTLSKCANCNFEAKSSTGLKTHIGRMHRNDRIKCDMCIQLFLLKKTLKSIWKTFTAKKKT